MNTNVNNNPTPFDKAAIYKVVYKRGKNTKSFLNKLRSILAMKQSNVFSKKYEDAAGNPAARADDDNAEELSLALVCDGPAPTWLVKSATAPYTADDNEGIKAWGELSAQAYHAINMVVELDDIVSLAGVKQDIVSRN